MVSVQNLHRPTLWGFFFACSPLLSARMPGLSIDRFSHVSHLCHPSMSAWSHARATPLVHDTWAGLRTHAPCRGPDLQGWVIPGLTWVGESAGGYNQHGLRCCPAQDGIAGTDAAGEHPQACACPRWAAMCRMTRVIQSPGGAAPQALVGLLWARLADRPPPWRTLPRQTRPLTRMRCSHTMSDVCGARHSCRVPRGLRRCGMWGGLRQCGALVLRRLCERSLGRPDEPRPITDEEMAQLVWDSRGLSDDLAGHSLLPCLPMPAWEGWRQGSPEGVPPPPAC
jgi:hypothetical protein